MNFPKLLPTIGESCARAAYVPACGPWDELSTAQRHEWEAVAMAAVTEYQAQLSAGEVNDRWREAALHEICTKG